MHSLEIKKVDKDIYSNQLYNFLPDRLIDIHTHVWEKDEKPADPSKLTWPSRVASLNPVEDLLSDYQIMFPGKKVTPCIFGNPTKGINVDEHNQYVSQKTHQYHLPGLLLNTPEMSGDDVSNLVEKYQLLGLKPYLSFAPGHIPENDIQIYDFLPKHQLEVANEKKWVIVLHIPRSERLKDPINLRQMLEIDREFPDIKLVIAHIGRAYCCEDIGDAFEILGKTKQLMFDFSANTNSTAMMKAVQCVGTKRVLFGSDMPILRMRMRRICENGKYINLVPPGLYGDVSNDPHLREVEPDEGEKLSFFLYEELLAFREATIKLNLTSVDLEDIFYNNAARILGLE